MLLCKFSRDLYNLSILELKKEYDKNGQVLDYHALKSKVSSSEEYRILGGMYYAILIEAIANYKKYDKLLHYSSTKNKQLLEKKNLTKIEPPSHCKTSFPIYLKRPRQEKEKIYFPKTKFTNEFSLDIPEQYADKEIKQVILRPTQNFRNWELIIQYQLLPIQNVGLAPNNTLGIDLGVSNFCTCVTNKGSSFIIDGRRLKSIIQGYCKYNKMLSKNKNKATRRRASLQRKTANRVRDYLNKTAAYLIKYCIQYRIGTLIVGWGLHFQKFYIGKQNNQIFSFFPYAVFVHTLETKCHQNEIVFRKVDESFSSQASALDLDAIPEHVTRLEQHFSGHRRYRGLYITKSNLKINADVNGALNILRKGNAITDEQIACFGSRGLVPPQRIFILSKRTQLSKFN